jgi:hypothetical protein
MISYMSPDADARVFELAGINVKRLALACGPWCVRPGLVDAMARTPYPFPFFNSVASNNKGKDAITESDAALSAIVSSAIAGETYDCCTMLLTNLCREDEFGFRTHVSGGGGAVS